MKKIYEGPSCLCSKLLPGAGHGAGSATGVQGTDTPLPTPVGTQGGHLREDQGRLVWLWKACTWGFFYHCSWELSEFPESAVPWGQSYVPPNPSLKLSPHSNHWHLGVHLTSHCPPPIRGVQDTVPCGCLDLSQANPPGLSTFFYSRNSREHCFPCSLFLLVENDEYKWLER